MTYQSLPVGYPYELAVAAEHNRLKVYETVIKAVESASIARKDIAAKIDRSPAQVSMLLSGPSNWTLDTVSNLLRAVGATMDYKVVFDKDRLPENYFNPLGEKPRTAISTTGTSTTGIKGNEIGAAGSPASSGSGIVGTLSESAWGRAVS